ncbi:MAG: MarR family transcriptional regulator [Selenomonadaceae bacterium]|nr:MarR family transcriptional regulator [Selenomonadaceae bacterium]
MKDTNNFIGDFLDANHLLNTYNLIWYRKNFGGIDPRQGQGRILSALRRMQSISQKELGYILDIRPQSLGELLQKLEANGYIRRYRSQADRRALIVELTEKGETFQRCKPDYEEIFVDMDARERAAFKKSLEKISARLSDMIEQESETYFY